MKRCLEEKAIIVVGAGTGGEGIGNGKAAAVQFAREGAKVLANKNSLFVARTIGKLSLCVKSESKA